MVLDSFFHNYYFINPVGILSDAAQLPAGDGDCQFLGTSGIGKCSVKLFGNIPVIPGRLYIRVAGAGGHGGGRDIQYAAGLYFIPGVRMYRDMGSTGIAAAL